MEATANSSHGTWPDSPLRWTHDGSCAERRLLGNWTVVKIKHRSDSPLKKKARRGFRGYPVATIAFYGPNDTRASKVAVAIMVAEGEDPRALERWFDQEGDVRRNPAIGNQILQFVQDHDAKTIVMTDSIIG